MAGESIPLTLGETRFAPFTHVVRRRLLPAAGEVLVSLGDQVQPEQVVARGHLPGQTIVMDLAWALKTDPQRAARALRVQIGQEVTPDTVLASRWRGLRQARARPPESGVVTGLHEGCLLMQPSPRLLALTASLPGEVVEVFPQRGVAIRTGGSLVRGAWGVGGERAGTLVAVSESPDAAVAWQQITLAQRGAILVAGVLVDHRVLFRARQFRLGGLVLGSMHPNLRPLCERLGLPVMVTEGLGRISMARAIFEHMRRCHGRLAFLSVSQSEAWPRPAPELVIPLPAQRDSTAVMLAHPLQVGVRVRLTRPPYLGLVGQVTELPPWPQPTAAGAPALGARVRLADGRRLFVPLVNLEVLS